MLTNGAFIEWFYKEGQKEIRYRSTMGRMESEGQCHGGGPI